MAITFNDYMPTIWNYFMRSDKIGNETGVAALMGNLYAESGCTPYACQPSHPYSICMTYIANVDSHVISEYSFVHKGTSSTGGVASGQGGFGLAQWTYYSRKQELYGYWENTGGSIGALSMQLDFCYDEMTRKFPSVLSALQGATDLRTASNKVLFDYENPKDKSQAVQDLRYSYSSDIYTRYTGTTPDEPSDPQPSPQDPPSPEPQNPISNSDDTNKRMPIWMYPMFHVKQL